MTNAGIYGLGVYLPTEIRKNDYWPERIVEKWPEHTASTLDKRGTGKPQEVSTGAQLVLQAMAEYRGDPFRGARERRVIDKNQRTSDMEVEAAQGALQDAGVKPEEIDLLLASTNLNDHHMVPNAPKLHRLLGLKKEVFSLQIDGICNSFQMQLEVAEQMIKTGRAKRALLVQSAVTSRLMQIEDPMSAWFGDAATALVLGPVSADYGILAQAHATDGRYTEGPVAGAPGKEWYEGPVRMYVKDEGQARAMLLMTIQDSKPLIHSALHDAGLSTDDVDFYAAHQGFAWLRKATQVISGLTHARTLDTFEWAASCLGCNIPLVLSTARKEGLLHEGDIVATFSGMPGVVLSSAVLRWGRK